MTRAVVAMVVLVGLGGSARTEPAGESTGEAEGASVEAEAKAFLALYQRTVRANDPEAIRRLYVDDGRFSWITDGEVRYRSADEIISALAGLAAAGMVFETEYAGVEVIALGRDRAAVTTSFQTNATVEGGSGFSFAGAITMLLERSSAGDWRVVHGHTSTPTERSRDDSN